LLHAKKNKITGKQRR